MCVCVGVCVFVEGVFCRCMLVFVDRILYLCVFSYVCACMYVCACLINHCDSSSGPFGEPV